MRQETLQPESKANQPIKQQETCMRTQLCPSMCRNCKFYQFQGRSGGHCYKLGIPVSGHWHSCPLALSPFTPSWEERINPQW